MSDMKTKNRLIITKTPFCILYARNEIMMNTFQCYEPVSFRVFSTISLQMYLYVL